MNTEERNKVYNCTLQNPDYIGHLVVTAFVRQGVSVNEKNTEILDTFHVRMPRNVSALEIARYAMTNYFDHGYKGTWRRINGYYFVTVITVVDSPLSDIELLFKRYPGGICSTAAKVMSTICSGTYMFSYAVYDKRRPAARSNDMPAYTGEQDLVRIPPVEGWGSPPRKIEVEQRIARMKIKLDAIHAQAEGRQFKQFVDRAQETLTNLEGKGGVE